jgi:hypothetical protein
MSIEFPSADFFRTLQERMAADPACTEGIAPSEAYCGFAIDDRLFVFEFDGRSCAATISGGNELDLDFVVAGPSSAWQRALGGLQSGDPAEAAAATLPALVKEGALTIRSEDENGPELAQAALPFLQVFLEQARGLELTPG